MFNMYFYNNKNIEDWKMKTKPFSLTDPLFFFSSGYEEEVIDGKCVFQTWIMVILL